MALIPLRIYFKTSCYCLGNFIKKVSTALRDLARLWLASVAGSQAPHTAAAEGPTPPGQRVAVPGGRGKRCGDSSFTAKHEAGAGEGAGLQEFY